MGNQKESRQRIAKKQAKKLCTSNQHSTLHTWAHGLMRPNSDHSRSRPFTASECIFSAAVHRFAICKHITLAAADRAHPGETPRFRNQRTTSTPFEKKKNSRQNSDPTSKVLSVTLFSTTHKNAKKIPPQNFVLVIRRWSVRYPTTLNPAEKRCLNSPRLSEVLARISVGVSSYACARMGGRRRGVRC